MLNRRNIKLLTAAMAVLQLISAVVLTAGWSAARARPGEQTVSVPICHKGGERRTIEIVLPSSGEQQTDETGGFPGCLYCSTHCAALALTSIDTLQPVVPLRGLRSPPILTHRPVETRSDRPWQARGPPASVRSV